MTVLHLLPITLSLLVLGAHFLRGGYGPLMVATALMFPLLAVRRPWAARVVQAALALGALEWARTLVRLASLRMQAGEPVLRLVIILGAVCAVTGLSALAFQGKTLGGRYRIRPEK